MTKTIRYHPFTPSYRRPSQAREARDNEWARLRERGVQAHRFTQYQGGIPVFCIRYPRGANINV